MRRNYLSFAAFAFIGVGWCLGIGGGNYNFRRDKRQITTVHVIKTVTEFKRPVRAVVYVNSLGSPYTTSYVSPKTSPVSHKHHGTEHHLSQKKGRPPSGIHKHVEPKKHKHAKPKQHVPETSGKHRLPKSNGHKRKKHKLKTHGPGKSEKHGQEASNKHKQGKPDKEHVAEHPAKHRHHDVHVKHDPAEPGRKVDRPRKPGQGDSTPHKKPDLGRVGNEHDDPHRGRKAKHPNNKHEEAVQVPRLEKPGGRLGRPHKEEKPRHSGTTNSKPNEKHKPKNAGDEQDGPGKGQGIERPEKKHGKSSKHHKPERSGDKHNRPRKGQEVNPPVETHEKMNRQKPERLDGQHEKKHGTSHQKLKPEHSSRQHDKPDREPKPEHPRKPGSKHDKKPKSKHADRKHEELNTNHKPDHVEGSIKAHKKHKHEKQGKKAPQRHPKHSKGHGPGSQKHKPETRHKSSHHEPKKHHKHTKTGKAPHHGTKVRIKSGATTRSHKKAHKKKGPKKHPKTDEHPALPGGYTMAYDPKHDDGTYKTVDEISADLGRLSGYTAVRLYRTDWGQVSDVLTAAQRHNLKIFPTTSDIVDLDTEIGAIIAACRGAWASVVAVGVGNELVNAGRASAAAVVAATHRARARLRRAGFRGPVVAPEVYAQVHANPVLCQAGDGVVAANAHPFFAGVTPRDAPGWVAREARALRRTCGGKRAFITETGWPNRGAANGAAVPSRRNQRAVVEGLRRRFGGRQVVLFMAFDAPWKASAEDVYGIEPHWGIF